MNPKYFIIPLVIVVALGGFFTYQKFISPEASEEMSEDSLSDICRKITTKGEQNYCLALVSGNDDFCQEMDIDGEREMCFAMVYEDPSYCREIQEPEPRKMCFYELAEATGNIDYCDEAEEKEHCYFNFVANLYWAPQLGEIKTEYCDKFSTQSPERATCLALKDEDISFCGEENAACLTFFEQDLSFCDTIGPGDKTTCVRDRAMMVEDPDICEESADGEARDECYFGYVSHFNPDVSLCDKIGDGKLKNMCYLEAAVWLSKGYEFQERVGEEAGKAGDDSEDFQKETVSCDEFCRGKSHVDCSGEWDVSGNYPDCVCDYKCETPTNDIVVVTGEPSEEEAQAEKETTLEPQTDWATFHGDIARTGFSNSRAPANPYELWKWTESDFRAIGYNGDFDVNWPIVEDNKVFIALEEIFALDLKTGEKLWSYSDGEDFYPRGLAVSDDKLFMTVNRGDNLRDLPPGFIYALDKNTGEFLWKYQTQAGISHSLPLFADDKIFVGDDSGNLYAVDSEGNLIWRQYLEDAEVIHSSPAFYQGSVFVGTEGSGMSNAMPSRLYALEADSGEELWRFEVDYLSGKLSLFHASPAISDRVVYIGSENGYFYAVNAADGSLVWKKLIASGGDMIVGVSGTASLGYGKVYIGTYEGNFLALDQDTGEIIWQYEFGKANADSSPLLADGKVYFGAGEGSDGNFYCFDAENGEVIWEKKLGGSPPALASGVLVVQNAWLKESETGAPAIAAYFDNY